MFNKKVYGETVECPFCSVILKLHETNYHYFFFICDDENLIQIERWNFTIHSFIQSHSVNDY